MSYPKGYLVSIGGAEDKGGSETDQERDEIEFFRYGILENVVKLMGRDAPTVEVITTASHIPDDYYKQYKQAFEKLGCAEVGHMKIDGRDLAMDKGYLHRLEKCDGVMFTGGDQLRLCSVLGGSPVYELMKERYHNDDFVIAGTSAGAAAMSNTMICGGNPQRAYFKGEVQLSLGFGFFKDVIIDTHFDKRGRFGRLAQAIAAQPGAIGIGLAEDTGIIVEEGRRFKAIGSSSVIVIEGQHVRYNNIAEIKTGMPLSVENLTVHIMAHSDIYDIENRKFKGVKFEPHEA